MSRAVQFTREQADSTSEFLTIVRLDSSTEHYSEALDGLSPFLVEVSTETDLIGVYDLDGDKIDATGESWEVATNVPDSVIEAVEQGWASGVSVVTRRENGARTTW